MLTLAYIILAVNAVLFTWLTKNRHRFITESHRSRNVGLSEDELVKSSPHRSCYKYHVLGGDTDYWPFAVISLLLAEFGAGVCLFGAYSAIVYVPFKYQLLVIIPVVAGLVTYFGKLPLTIKIKLKED